MKPGQLWAQLAQVALADAGEREYWASCCEKDRPVRAGHHRAEAARLQAIAVSLFERAGRHGFQARDSFAAFDTRAWQDEAPTLVD